MSVKIKGLDKLVKKLNKFGDDGERAIVSEITTAATNIERNAIARAPFEIKGIPTGIKGKIAKEITNRGLTAKVLVRGVSKQEPFPAHVEYGTGINFTQLVASDPSNYDADVQKLAYEFFINGLGTLPATPYLWPSFFEERPKLLEELERKLTALANKV